MAKTELQRLIGEKWFLTLERLGEEIGVSGWTIQKAFHGEKILPQTEERLRKYLEKL